MAIVVPLVVSVLLGTIEFGRIFQVSQVLTNSASVGARSASVGNSAAAVEATVRNGLPDLNQANLVVTVTNAQGPPGADVTVDLAYQHTLMTGYFDALLGGGSVNLTSSSTHRLE